MVGKREKIAGGRAGVAMAAAMGGGGGGGGGSTSIKEPAKKSHRAAQSGPAAEKKKSLDKKKRGVGGDKENPKVGRTRNPVVGGMWAGCKSNLQRRWTAL